MDTFRAWAEVDLDALTRNVRAIRRRLPPQVAVVLVTKADAYGHGAVAVAHHVSRLGVGAVAVSSCQEALELREAGVRGRILVLGAVLGEEALQTLDWDVEIGVPSPELCRLIERVARRRARRIRVHLKVDTGMNRLGVAPVEVLGLLSSIERSSYLELGGIMTHLAATDGVRSQEAHDQLRRFDDVLERARAQGLVPAEAWVHAANSAAVFSGAGGEYDAVRVGIAAYGVPPDPALETSELEPVLSVRTKIVHLRRVAVGDRVGYGGSWRARRPSWIATLPLGYDDGVAWRLGGRGEVLVGGRRAPIVGRISMDYTTIDVTDVPGVDLGAHATLIGSDGRERIQVTELAERAGTIPYEILCSIGKRVRRRYVGGDGERTSGAHMLDSEAAAPRPD